MLKVSAWQASSMFMNVKKHTPNYSSMCIIILYDHLFSWFYTFQQIFFWSCCRHLLSFSHKRISEFYTDFGCKAWPAAGIPVHPKGAGTGVRIGGLCMPVKFFPNKPEKLFFSRIWLCAWGCVYIETENTATELEARFCLKVCCVVLMWKSTVPL